MFSFENEMGHCIVMSTNNDKEKYELQKYMLKHLSTLYPLTSAGLSRKEITLIVHNTFARVSLDHDALLCCRRDAFCDSETLRTLMHYRFAHSLYNYTKTDEEDEIINLDVLQQFAMNIVHDGSRNNQVFIHPNTKIGNGFVIKNGRNIFIGEKTIIGDSCCIENNVTIGAGNISSKETKIGNDVKISLGSHVINAVEVGDCCKIFPYSLIDRNIPDNTSVYQMQAINSQITPSGVSNKINIFGIIPKDSNGSLEIHGTNLKSAQISPIYYNGKEYEPTKEDIPFKMQIINKSYSLMSVQISLSESLGKACLEDIHEFGLMIRNDSSTIIIQDSVGLICVLKSLLSKKEGK